MNEIKENDPNAITPFAVTNYRDIRRIFGIKQKNRRGHMYVIGKTGTGKSTLLLNMIVSDIREGRGVALIDPHGDLAERALDFVPKNRIEDVIYFNPADLEYPIAFNPLEKCSPYSQHLVTSGLISVFKKIWPDFWGPRLEHILRHSIFTLLEYPGATLLDLPRLLTNKDFRFMVLKLVLHFLNSPILCDQRFPRVGPVERCCICFIVAFYVLHGLIHQFLFALPDAAANDISGENTEPYFNLI